MENCLPKSNCESKINICRASGKFIPRNCWGSIFDGLDAREKQMEKTLKPVPREPYTGPVFTPKK